MLAEHGITMVNGGGGHGLMTVVADAVLANGGKVVGVIPRSLVEREWAHKGLTELHIVESMHDRKALMAQLADAFIAMPGGIGTLDELFEIWTWRQLGLHTKPVALLNTDGFFSGLLTFLDHQVDSGFLPMVNRDELIVASDPAVLLSRILQTE